MIGAKIFEYGYSAAKKPCDRIELNKVQNTKGDHTITIMEDDEDDGSSMH
jgi:hypothetical protein